MKKRKEMMQDSPEKFVCVRLFVCVSASMRVRDVCESYVSDFQKEAV